MQGGRERLSAGVIKGIDREINRAAARFKVSRSFVVAVALASHFGVSEQEQFDTRRDLRVVRRRA